MYHIESVSLNSYSESMDFAGFVLIITILGISIYDFYILRKSGVDWLVVDTTRSSVSNYEPFADLVKTSGSVSLWKITDPYLGEVLKQSDPCGPKSVQIIK